MSFHLWLTFAVASAALLATPGPTLFTVMSYSLAHGRRVGAPLVAAVVLGDATALSLALLGLGALLAASALWFTVLQWAGSLYLVYLGAKLFRAGASAAGSTLPVASPSRRRTLADAYLVTALNPKGMVFFVAFLPQFVSPAPDPTVQLWILAATFMGLAGLNAALYVVFASKLRRVWASPRALRRLYFAGGTLLLCAAAWTLLAERPA